MSLLTGDVFTVQGKREVRDERGTWGQRDASQRSYGSTHLNRVCYIHTSSGCVVIVLNNRRSIRAKQRENPVCFSPQTFPCHEFSEPDQIQIFAAL